LKYERINYGNLFLKHTSGMNKEIRDWSIYIEIESLIKTTLTSLRALIELQNPSMKERHWEELMELINVI